VRDASNPPRYVLWGSAGHAKVLASLIALRGGQVLALFDNREVASVIDGVALHIGEAGFHRWADEAHNLTSVFGLAAIGGHRGRDRIAIHALFRRRGLRLASLVHPDASVCSTVLLGTGTQVLAQAVVAAGTRIGEACIVNHRAGVDHECVLGDGVHIAPGATLCGCVTVGDNVMVGAGAVVLPRLSIGADSMIGAGAVVTQDVPAGVTVAGNPARVLGQR
jgi:sugar O-acyltransferase (sialic acid O-acetyltransferase NeuD family)